MIINESVIFLDKMKGANSYLYISDDGDISLIDTGMPGNLKVFMREIVRYDISPDKISFIILTHGDIDHAGSAAEISGATGARIAAHVLECPYLSGVRRKIHHGFFPVTLSILSGLIPMDEAVPAIKLNDGDVIGDLNIIHCPGHTEGSIALYSRGRFMFSGDTLCTDRYGRVKGFSPRFTEDSTGADESMRKLSSLDFDTLLPGHGKCVIGNASSHVRAFMGI